MGDIVNMADHSDSSSLWTPEQMADQVAQDYRSGDRSGTKALVLHLDTTDGQYSVGFTQAGMKATEMIALMRVVEANILREMGY